ncbi:MAG TPA: hypothetical protein VGJ32_13930 [Solirubrobacteraceae bacterium]
MHARSARLSRLLVAFACLAASAALPTTAAADVRVGQVSDPVDQIPDLNGASRIPDFEQVRVSFDQATGAVSATVRFYQPIDYTNPGHRLEVDLGRPTVGSICSPGDVLMGADVAPGAAKSSFMVARFTGAGDGTLTISPDKREMTLAFSHPTLVKADLRCFNAHTITYDDVGHCGNPECTFFSHTFVHDTVDTSYFNGYAPAPTAVPELAACRDGEDNDRDGKVDFDDPGCHGDASGTSEVDPAPVASRVALKAKRSGCGIDVRLAVQPALKPAEVFPLARAAVTVRGRGYSKTRRVVIGDPEGSRFGGLRTGRYRVSARYLGDKWRKAARAPAQLVTLKGRSCRH